MNKTREHLREVMRKAGMLPEGKTGCPRLPQLRVVGDRVEGMPEFLAAAQAAHAAGHAAALLHALRVCHTWGHPLPAWVVRALHVAAVAWFDGAADTLDEALGLVRADRKTEAATVRRIHGAQMLIDARREIKSGHPIGPELWESLAERFGGSARTAESIVRDLAKELGIRLGKRRS